MMSSLVLVDETRPNPDEALSGVIFAPTLDAHPSCNAQEHDIVRFRRMRIQTHPRKSDVQVSIFVCVLCVCVFVRLCVCVCVCVVYVCGRGCWVGVIHCSKRRGLRFLSVYFHEAGLVVGAMAR